MSTKAVHSVRRLKGLSIKLMTNLEVTHHHPLRSTRMIRKQIEQLLGVNSTNADNPAMSTSQKPILTMLVGHVGGGICGNCRVPDDSGDKQTGRQIGAR